MQFWVADKRTGFMVEQYESYEKAQDAVNDLTAKEWEKGDRRFMFEIVNEDHKPILRYMARIIRPDGTRIIDAVSALEGYTLDDYFAEHNGLDGCQITVEQANI